MVCYVLFYFVCNGGDARWGPGPMLCPAVPNWCFWEFSCPPLASLLMLCLFSFSFLVFQIVLHDSECCSDSPHFCMAMVFAKDVSASAAAAFHAASEFYADAPAAIAASFARFAKVAMTVAFCVCLDASACLILSCLAASASAAAESLPASRLAFLSICC